MRRGRLAALWALAIALVFAPAYCAPRSDAPVEPSFALRLLGPVASFAAGVQWVRVDGAIRAGRTDLALSRAETALAIDPSATGGWLYLARHLAFDLASAEREPNAERRLAWLRASLAVLERGEATAADPAELVVTQGLFLALAAAAEQPPPWPGGLRAMWLEAAQRFDRAAALGHPLGAELARRARTEADLAPR